MLLTLFWTSKNIYRYIFGKFTTKVGPDRTHTILRWTSIYALYRCVVSTLTYTQAYTRGRSQAEVVTVLIRYSERTVNYHHQLKTYTFPNRLVTHMRSSSFNLYTIRQCSLPFKTVGKIIDVASQSTLQTANTAGLHELSMWQAFVARQSTNQTVNKVGHYIK